MSKIIGVFDSYKCAIMLDISRESYIKQRRLHAKRNPGPADEDSFVAVRGSSEKCTQCKGFWLRSKKVILGPNL